MKQNILEQLAKLEQAQDVTILYACESGSRAWGFASPDSDYDVRFIYVRTADAYLSLSEKKDVIELPVNALLDISGWDLKKALQLFLKSNAPLYEWLQSPVIYYAESSFTDALKELMPQYFSHRAACHHYLSITHNVLADLREAEVSLKKYFYALRPLLATLWILEKQAVPPIEFAILRNIVADKSWQDAVDTLLQQKATLDEKARIKPVPLLQNWIMDMIPYSKSRAHTIPAFTGEIATLNDLFKKYIRYT